MDDAANHLAHAKTILISDLQKEIADLKRLATPEGLRLQRLNYEQWERATHAIEKMTVELREAAEKLKPPFLALPEEFTPEQLAYRRGARDAYLAALKVLKGLA